MTCIVLLVLFSQLAMKQRYVLQKIVRRFHGYVLDLIDTEDHKILEFELKGEYSNSLVDEKKLKN